MHKYSVKKIENEIELRMLTAMIVNTRALREITPIYNDQIIQVPFVRTVAQWCLDYFKRYGKAPRRHITDLFRAKIRKDLEEDQASLIEDFLSNLSDQYERMKRFNVSYLLDEVRERFRSRALEMLAEDIQAELSQGKPDEAENLLTKFRKVAPQSVHGLNPWSDEEAILRAFEEADESLFEFPGDFGRMVNDKIVRSGLIGIMGRVKIGKSFMLQEWAYRASRARCNVAYFEAGDHTEEEVIRRFHVRHSGRNYLRKYCREMIAPILDCRKNQDNTCRLKERACDCGLEGAESPDEAPKGYRPCSVCYKLRPSKFRGTCWYHTLPKCEPLTPQECLRAGRQMMKRIRGRDFRLASFPNSSLSVHMIQEILEAWEIEDGFVPDVIVIDYADILAPELEDARKETRHQQNGTWKALRRLAQTKHALVLTVTQSDTESFDAHTLQLRHFSEARAKYDHVTAMLTLNQTGQEKDLGLLRIGSLLFRHGEYNPRDQVVILQCLQRGQPFLGCFRYHRGKKRGGEE